MTPQGLTINTVRNSTEYQSPADALSPVNKKLPAQLMLQANILNGAKGKMNINIGASQRPNNKVATRSQVFYIKKEHERLRNTRKTERIISDQNILSTQSPQLVVRPDELFKTRDLSQASKISDSNRINGVTKSR